MKITVKSFEKKTSKNNKEYLLVSCVEGLMSCWDPELFDQFEKGAILDAFVKEDNGYKTIAGIERRTGTAEIADEPPKSKFAGGAMGAMKEASKMKKDSMIISNALNNATQYGIALNLSWEQVVANAMIAIKQFNED